MKNDQSNNPRLPSWEELRETRVSVSIGEFCRLTGWHRSRFHRHRHLIKQIQGFGRPMIPVAEVERIINGEEAAQ